MSKVHSLIVAINTPTDLPVKIGIVGVSIKAVNLPGAEVIAFPEQRKFVPSFDKTKSDSLLIASWSNKDEEDAEDRIILTGEVDLIDGTILFCGGGYESVEVEVLETLPVPEEVPTEDVGESLEDVPSEEE